ncbi:cobalamin biosynthesis protein CbiL [Kaistia geumhonensis]|uniref:Nickel transport protein n=1 Tax=Kaistia geumhonensis TaxID=410839 RepID=A0ABU0M417_9HYPH|nr:cobalamin biosynthesis protein CbiL [Kaistia geumhonensis]MCX5479072.1 cobalamin biosynthesis protein CbiL [Kaistia geumhonensis]MDQ0515708.1 nickel transport protein [Kaistia geumhonensis]
MIVPRRLRAVWARPLLVLAVFLSLALPAEAHKLKVFAAVEGRSVHGYAFFIGGGRPEGSAWVAKDAAGAEIASGTTDAEGRLAFDLPATSSSDVTVTVDTHEAHIASATLAARTIGAADAGEAPTPARPAPAAPRMTEDARLAALVAAAVERGTEPLQERIELMDSRLRFADILSGVFLIIGLAGIGLWARGRRR